MMSWNSCILDNDSTNSNSIHPFEYLSEQKKIINKTLSNSLWNFPKISFKILKWIKRLSFTIFLHYFTACLQFFALKAADFTPFCTERFRIPVNTFLWFLVACSAVIVFEKQQRTEKKLYIQEYHQQQYMVLGWNVTSFAGY